MNSSVLVQKFGGTSVATAERRAQVVGHVRRALDQGHRVASVVSAMGRRGDPYATDTLLDLLRSGGAQVAPADYDLMFACGEIISVALMAHTLRQAGLDAMPLTAAQAGILTDGHHVEAEIEHIDTARLRLLLSQGAVPVVCGGQGVAPGTLDFTTLGRGGSDTSAVALGVALGAARVEIYTDVERVLVTDPKLVPTALAWDHVSFESMYEMARFGAKVVHPRALLTAWRAGMPVESRSTFTVTPGTLIGDVRDPAPLVGLSTLPAMETVVLRLGSLTGSVREEWERKHLIMSIEDRSRSELLIGAGIDKRRDLEAELAKAGLAPVHRLGETCWVSVVGDAAGLPDALEASRRRLGVAGFDVAAFETRGRRCTFIVPGASPSQVVPVVYEAAFGVGPA